MATKGQTALTLLDWAKRTDPQGRVPVIVEALNATNEILDDAMFVEGNLTDGHQTTVRTGLPSVTWRQLNYGVVPSKSRTAQVKDSCGRLEALSQIDKALLELNGNDAEFRFSEDRSFLEAMNQEAATTMIYGNVATDPVKFTGLAPRYNSTTAESYNNVIVGSTATSSTCTSIWLVIWGDQTIHGIFPKGTRAGLEHNDLGQRGVSDGNGGSYEAMVSQFLWRLGLTVRDWRYAVRIANIETSTLASTTTAQSALVTLMTRATERIPAFGMGRAAFYCNNTIRENLRLGVLNKVSNSLTFENVAGKRVTMFDGIPVRRVDGIVNTESAIV